MTGGGSGEQSWQEGEGGGRGAHGEARGPGPGPRGEAGGARGSEQEAPCGGVAAVRGVRNRRWRRLRARRQRKHTVELIRSGEGGGGNAPHATAMSTSKPPCGGRGREAPSVPCRARANVLRLPSPARDQHTRALLVFATRRPGGWGAPRWNDKETLVKRGHRVWRVALVVPSITCALSMALEAGWGLCWRQGTKRRRRCDAHRTLLSQTEIANDQGHMGMR